MPDAASCCCNMSCCCCNRICCWASIWALTTGLMLELFMLARKALMSASPMALSAGLGLLVLACSLVLGDESC